MTKDESLALLAQGKDAWNAWAQDLLDRKARLEGAGLWAVDERGKGLTEEAKRWEKEARVNFKGVTFSDEKSFEEFIFPGQVSFDHSCFREGVSFSTALFNGDVSFSFTHFNEDIFFSNAHFNGGISFYNAHFDGYFDFSNIRFDGNVDFSNIRFDGDVSFSGIDFSGGIDPFFGTHFKGQFLAQKIIFHPEISFVDVTFEKTVLFKNCQFLKRADFSLLHFPEPVAFAGNVFAQEADFSGIDVQKTFSLAQTEFKQVPDFTEAHFREPPRLDHIRVALPGWWYFWGDPDREARFRALKRLALAAQDHENEQIFFKGELKERRGHTDRWYHPSYWLGWGYEIFSDFGRSVLRPTLFWLAAVLVCACCYFYMSVKTPLAPGMPREMSTITALDNMLSAPLQSCRAGVLGDGRPYPGTRLTAALGISLGRGLLGGLGVEFGLEEKTHQFYSCLYGTHPPVLPAPDASPAAAASALLKHPPEALQYHIPTSVAFLGLLQSLFSAVLIFFFLLALRNRFKIK